MISIIQGTSRKPVASDRLVRLFMTNPEIGGSLYIGYPIIGTPDGAYPIDAMWVSPERGIVIINLIEGRDTGDFAELQDDSFNRLEAKLKNNKLLVSGRSLRVDINVVSYAPAAIAGPADPAHPLLTDESFMPFVSALPGDARNISAYPAVLSVIQSISSIRKGRKRRETVSANSFGGKLKELEDSIANLDSLQGRAVIETVEGVQRIRGLAGSGKTIVLALKAAYLHAQHPDWRIAVTFNTRSLKGQFRRLITTFVVEQTGEEPDWERINIVNAWGAPGGPERNGIYYTYCVTNSAPFFDYGMAKARFGSGREFVSVCALALTEAKSQIPVYDAILVDEAQDLSPAFLRICYSLLGDSKRLVYAYDELQNLSGESLPSPEEIFGSRADGTPLVSFQSDRQDVILEKCYRNSRPVLVTAHALGFGIYRDPQEQANAGAGPQTGLIQMFERPELWLDVGYKVETGLLEDGHEVSLTRTPETSPPLLERVADCGPIIEFLKFNDEQHQAEWLAAKIQSDLGEGELEPSDIVVINPDPLSTRGNVGLVRKILFERSINSHLAGVDTSPDVFFDQDGKSIAFTGIHRAKGNEAGMVYVINAQDCYGSFGNLARIRNRLFTAITRSKAWVRVLGIGERMERLMAEFQRVYEHDYKLQFRYPTADERKLLNIINRDMSAEEKKKVKGGRTSLVSLLEDIEAGRVFVEDLPAEQVRRLREFLSKV